MQITSGKQTEAKSKEADSKWFDKMHVGGCGLLSQSSTKEVNNRMLCCCYNMLLKQERERLATTSNIIRIRAWSGSM